MTEVEKEINIEPSIDDNNENDNNDNDNNDNDNVNINIERKPIKDLTKEEKDIIINNAKNGIKNDYYDVKLFKNGNARIVLKKDKPLTVSQKYINKNKDDNNLNNKVYLSNDQLLMEHIIELHSQLNKLQGKQKKLKKKYYNLKNDIYEDIDDTPDINSANNESDNIQQANNNDNNDIINNNLNNNIKLNVNNQRGWRSRVSYL